MKSVRSLFLIQLVFFDPSLFGFRKLFKKLSFYFYLITILFLKTLLVNEILHPYSAMADLGKSSFFIKKDGSLWGMGCNNLGKLGVGKKLEYNIDRMDHVRHFPEQIFPSKLAPHPNHGHDLKEKVFGISVGQNEAFFITEKGDVWSTNGNCNVARYENCWFPGLIHQGTIWNKEKMKAEYRPIKSISANRDLLMLRSDDVLIQYPKGVIINEVKHMATGSRHNLCVKKDGSLWAWGSNDHGQLGDGTTIDRFSPIQIVSSGVSYVAAGAECSLFVKTDGSLWIMGYDKPNPRKIFDNVKSVATSNYSKHWGQQIIAQTDDGLWTWGINKYINPSGGLSQIGSSTAQFAMGRNHYMVLSGNGRLVVAGANDRGQLGQKGWTGINDSISDVIQLPEIFPKNDYVLSANIIEEKKPNGIEVGKISSSSGVPITYSLSSGVGDSGNPNFTLSSDGILRSSKSFDYGLKKEYSIRVNASSASMVFLEKVFSIRISAALDFSLSSNFVKENQPIGTKIGNFNNSSNEKGEYTLIGGIGSDGNPNFSLNTDGFLHTSKTFDFEKNKEFSIRVRFTPSGKSPKEKVFTIRVLDVVETLPFDFVLSPHSVEENKAIGTKVGKFSIKGKQDNARGLVGWWKFDGDYSDSSGSGLSGTPDGVSFSIDRNGESNRSIYFDGINDTFTFDIGSQHYSNFSVSFWAEPLKATTIVGESTKGGAMATPAHSTLMYYPMGNKGLRQVGFGIVLGSNALNIAHLTGGRAPATLAYPSDMSGWKHYVVCCINNKVRLFVNGNFVKDGLQFDRTNVIGASIILGKNYKNGHYKGSIDNFRIYDRAMPLTEVTSLYKKDTELQEKIEYSLVSGAGSEGNQNFTLSSEGVLKTAKSFDYELKQKHSIRVLAKSSRKTPTEKVFEIEVLDINESNPRLIILSHGKVSENLPIHSKVGEFSIKAGGSAIFELVKGEGDSGNEFFTIASGGILKTSVILNSSQSPTLSIRVQATQLGVRILETFVIEVQKMSLPPPPPPPPPPLNDWKERWEKEKKELVNINNQIVDRNATFVKLEDQIRGVQDQIDGVGKNNVRLDTEISKTETELNQILFRIAELSVKYTDAQKHSEKIILQKRNAEKEVVRLSQEYDLLDQKVREKREEATTLVAKLKVPYLKGWHYTADKGWLWTDLDYYPIVYSNAEDAWIHYDQGTSNPWHYYNYSTQEWFEWE